MKATPPSLIATSSITLMEIEFGLQLAPAHARKLAPIMQAVLQTMTILPWAIEDAKATAALRAALQKKGRPIGAYDALIAGCALARGLTLVSSNEREFRRIGGLQIENWRKSEA